MKRATLRSVLLFAILGFCTGCDSLGPDHGPGKSGAADIRDRNVKVVIATTMATDLPAEGNVQAYVRDHVLHRLNALGEDDLNSFSPPGRDEAHYTLRYRINSQYDHYSGSVDVTASGSDAVATLDTGAATYASLPQLLNGLTDRVYNFIRHGGRRP
jgi:hypothetical protein